MTSWVRWIHWYYVDPELTDAFTLHFNFHVFFHLQIQLHHLSFTFNFVFFVQLVQLLLKSSQDKRFVCEAAESALIALTSSVSPLLLLPKLEPHIKNRNPRIRAKASMCISRTVLRMVRSLG